MIDVREALDGSISKWFKIVNGTGEDNGADDCPLCHLFNGRINDRSYNCNGCPIREDTGKDFCDNTPYVQWDRAYYESLDNDQGGYDHTPQSFNAALGMYDYLVKLKEKLYGDEQ